MNPELEHRLRLTRREFLGRSGTGLGLAIVKRVAELHGGRVGLESAPSRGATFWMLLPAA